MVAVLPCLLAAVYAFCASAQPVELTLVAPWAAAPFAVEFLETIAGNNDTLYYALLDDFIQRPLDTGTGTATPEAIYEDGVHRVHQLLGGGSYAALGIAKMALVAHAAAPRVEAYYQHYSDEHAGAVPPCDVWLQTEQGPLCTMTDLTAVVGVGLDSPVLLPFDHVHRSPKATSIERVAILYTKDVISSRFADFHRVLTKAVQEQAGLAYVVRYIPHRSSSPLVLSGYGVELALKKTDYLVIDDRASSSSSVKSKLANLGKKISQTLFEGTPLKIDPLTANEIHELGLKAAQFVQKSKNPLSALVQLSQDFPRYARSVADLSLDQKLATEVISNQAIYQGPSNGIWLNGREVDDLDPFSLVRQLQNELQLMEAFEKIGLRPHEVVEVMTNPGLAKTESHLDGGLTDVYNVRSDLVIWLNDLEKDKRYRSWSNKLVDMLKPVYPGQMRAIARNIYTLVMVEDLGSTESLKRVTKQVVELVKHNTPIRFGVLPAAASDDSPSTAAAVAFSNIYATKGKLEALGFLDAILSAASDQELSHATIEIVIQAYNDKVGDPLVSLLDHEKDRVGQIRNFLKRFGIMPDVPVLFLNGKLIEHSTDQPWTRSLMMSMNQQTQLIARDIYFGSIDEEDDVYDYLLSKPYVATSRNPYIITSESQPLRMLPLHLEELSIHYIYGKDPTSVDTNIWVVADFDTVPGLKLAYEALEFLGSADNIRLALVHNPPGDFKNTKVSVVLYREMLSGNKDLQQLIKTAIATKDVSLSEGPEQIKMFAPGSPVVESVANDALYRQSKVLAGLGLEKDFMGIIINGRVVGPFTVETEFTKDDLESLYHFEKDKRIQPVYDAIRNITIDRPLPDVLTIISIILEADKASVEQSVFEGPRPTLRERPYSQLRGEYTKITVGNPEKAFAQIGVVLDPVSETAQKWSGLLEALAGVYGIYIELYLNPVPKLTEIPLKRFYRYVFEPEPTFDPATGMPEPPSAYFDDLPEDGLYTLGMDVIDPWHVTVKEANVDLDNIKPDTMPVEAVYELEYILVEGHCLDVATRGPPRGLQFVLGTKTSPAMTDTVVMANLGYFQLKARPGLWELALRDGRSKQVYHIESVGTQGTWQKKPANDGENPAEIDQLALTSFEGLTIFPQVRKNKAMENEDVLSDNTDPGPRQNKESNGFWSALGQKFFGKEGGRTSFDGLAATRSPQADINIFSVASGHLYERFMSIMIASVMEHTDSSVKFWFIENFLSPSFKDFLPHLAREKKFDYELVTYKWPSWLRSQTEKQRTIWGYKILFLDVLFPLDLDKVIFVDADQIVRTDLQELVDLDLHGAPYGYTPFCKDRTEMDGFRFWNQGYWKSHLKDKPYHISALYVIDLDRFRHLAAGDRLRAQYQQLSADPNSLANLDQDLPNNMQHIVPIYSLPQEWLWCETWCSDESLAKAKTIDLCNNPLTKEPKLDRARRQVPEWELYDEQIETLRRRVEQQAYVDYGDETTSSSSTAREHVADEL